NSPAGNGIIPRGSAGHAAPLRCPLHGHSGRRVALVSLGHVRFTTGWRCARLRGISHCGAGFAPGTGTHRARRPGGARRLVRGAARARARRTSRLDLSLARSAGAEPAIAWRAHGSARRAGDPARLARDGLDIRGERAMTLLLDAGALARRRIAAQSALAPLTASLRADLQRVIDVGIA